MNADDRLMAEVGRVVADAEWRVIEDQLMYGLAQVDVALDRAERIVELRKHRHLGTETTRQLLDIARVLGELEAALEGA